MSTIFVDFEEIFGIQVTERASHIKWHLYFTKAFNAAQYVGFQTVFHGTPRYSQTPQLQQELFSSHRFNILGFHQSLCYMTLPPWQPESGYITLLLKTLQGPLIKTITCYVIL